MKRLTTNLIGFGTTLALALLVGGCTTSEKGGTTRTLSGIALSPDSISSAQMSEGATATINAAGSSGALTIPIGSFTNSATNVCFPSAQGWSKSYVTFYFLGPNVSPLPNPNPYPNPANESSVTIDTLAPENGSTLDTGIVIVDNLDPTKKVCNDDAVPQYAPNPKLSKAVFNPTGSNRKYRVAVFYKKPLPAGVTNIVMHWSYP